MVRPLAIDLGHAYDSDRAAATAPPDVAAVLAGLTDNARTSDGPLTTDVTGLSTTARHAVSRVLEQLFETARAEGEPHRDVMLFMMTGWHEWMRHAA